jgi:hypothetical protein
MGVVDVRNEGDSGWFVLWYWNLARRFHGSFYLAIIVSILFENLIQNLKQQYLLVTFHCVRAG